jgi:hypothetical protein
LRHHIATLSSITAPFDRLTPQVTGHVTNGAIGAVGISPSDGPATLLLFVVCVIFVMTDQELIFSALRQVGVIVAEHLESGTPNADEAITQLVALLDTPELAAAMNRVERGFGLRVVK